MVSRLTYVLVDRFSLRLFGRNIRVSNGAPELFSCCGLRQGEPIPPARKEARQRRCSPRMHPIQRTNDHTTLDNRVYIPDTVHESTATLWRVQHSPPSLTGFLPPPPGLHVKRNAVDQGRSHRGAHRGHRTCRSSRRSSAVV